MRSTDRRLSQRPHSWFVTAPTIILGGDVLQTRIIEEAFEDHHGGRIAAEAPPREGVYLENLYQHKVSVHLLPDSR